MKSGRWMAMGVAALAALGLTLVPALAEACGGDGQMAMKKMVKKVSVTQLAGMLEGQRDTGRVAVVDVSSEKTRAKHGVIPGAILLSSSSQYLPEKELPADKNTALVFYCANTHCGASKGAAKKALQAGYTDVSVLPVGIAGWVEAGQNTGTI